MWIFANTYKNVQGCLLKYYIEELDMYIIDTNAFCYYEDMVFCVRFSEKWILRRSLVHTMFISKCLRNQYLWKERKRSRIG